MVEAALAAAVLEAVVSAVTKSLAAEACKLWQKRSELRKGFPNDMKNLKSELGMFQAGVEDQITRKGDPCAVMRASMEEMRDLAHDVEDCLDRILRDTEDGKKEASLHFAEEVKKLIERLKAARQRIKAFNANSNNGTQLSSATQSNAAEPSKWPSSASAVGIDEPKNQLVELLLTEDAEGQSKKPKVISIVGFGGSGKTTLAKKVYHHCNLLEDRFPCRAWVVASKHGDDIKSLLTELLGKICPREEAGEDVEQLRTKISNYLSNKRYLIVLDDIKEANWWHSIESTFFNNKSRIIVTTTVQTVAKVCSYGNGYVHNMETLDDKHSKELLISVLTEHSSWLEQSSTSIVNKCDGHPLSLDAVARYLQKEHVINKRVCENLSNELGYRVATEDDAFLKLREVLMENYISLPSKLPNIKACLMYMSVFPNGCHIKRTRLTRRWLAEQYVQHENQRTAPEVADEFIMKLVDRNIISRIGTSKNTTQVKSCRAHGIMHEFMLHMSQSAKFITSLDDRDRRNYRHLFREGRLSTSSGRSSNLQNHGHNSPAQGSKIEDKIFKFLPFKAKPKEEEKNKLRAHSVTIHGNAGEAVGDFHNCELLRVLDLEECNDLKDDDIDGIHDLWHLKYLSLGANISRLPREIEKLYCLQTLDVRKTKKEITLPVVVIKLPHLAHLLGKFKLEKNWKKRKVKKYAQESNLQTLAGFVTDDDPGSPMLMIHMKKLQKIKAWCNSDGKELLDAIMHFVGSGTCDGDRSLSLYLGNMSRNFLSSLESALENSYGYLSSLKIHGALGALDRLTLLATSLLGLKELCLSSANDLTVNKNDLSNLGRLMCLEYLKLVNISLESLVIRRLHFPKLLCLCLVQSPALPVVENEALQQLVSLQLLAQDLRDLSGIKIEQHKLLQEVALDSKVNEETKKKLEAAAQKHPNCPRVLYLDRVNDPDETGSTVKYVAAKRPTTETGSSFVHEQVRVHEEKKTTLEDEFQKHRKRPSVSNVDRVDAKRPALETRSSIVQEEQQIRPVESSLDIKMIISDMEQTTVSGLSPVSADLCSSMDIEMPSSSKGRRPAPSC